MIKIFLNISHKTFDYFICIANIQVTFWAYADLLLLKMEDIYMYAISMKHW